MSSCPLLAAQCNGPNATPFLVTRCLRQNPTLFRQDQTSKSEMSGSAFPSVRRSATTGVWPHLEAWDKGVAPELGGI